MEAPLMKPKSLKEYTYKQSKYEQAPKLPTREIWLGSSGTGKTCAIQQMALDVYRGCFERIYVFSPSVHLDMTWQPVKDFCTKHLDTGHEPCFFETFQEDKIREVLDVQKSITEDLKKRGKKQLWGVWIIIDDFADDSAVCRGSQGDILKTLFIRGRHHGVSISVLTQKYRLLSPVLRTQATALFTFKLRSNQDLEAFISEATALTSKKTLMRYYREATDQPFGFLFINLQASDMFWSRFDYPLQ